MIRKRVGGGPKIPERYFVFVGYMGNGGIDAVIAFKVVGFGCQDRYHIL